MIDTCPAGVVTVARALGAVPRRLGLWLAPVLAASPLPAAPSPVTATRPSMAVVIPARDEEGTLPTLLASVLPQLRDGDTCVVVDDESSDATAAVAEAAGAAHGRPARAPDGWTGKPGRAPAADALEARACDVLVFLDADVRLDGHDVLDRLAAEVAAAPQALVSVQPWHRTVRPVEQLSVFFNITAPMGSTGFTALGRRVRCSLAFGPVRAPGRRTRRLVGTPIKASAAPWPRTSLARRSQP